MRGENTIAQQASKTPRRRASPSRNRAKRENDVAGRLRALAHNLRWTWDSQVQRLFAAADPVAWQATHHNPIATLESLGPAHLQSLAADEVFVAHLESCEAGLKCYLRSRRPPLGIPRSKPPLMVAYFCAEFGLHECMPQYAGGLGILAGDHLKTASDLGIPLVGVGLLYRSGYYQQQLDAEGTTRPIYPRHDFRQWPIERTGRTIVVPLGNRSITAAIWKAQIGGVQLFLLDADVANNRPGDRALTHHLYGGNSDNRIRQQILLGVGGVRALDAMGAEPTVYHLNEGHAAFCVLERLRSLRASGMTLSEATRRVTASTVFTTHTPVPAGHDRYEPALVFRSLRTLVNELGWDRHELLAQGRTDVDDKSEPFCMTVLALRYSARCNGVSELHGEVSRRMWEAVDTPIGHVTNGVHVGSWLAPEMEAFYRKFLRPRGVRRGRSDSSRWDWKRTKSIPIGQWWEMRCLLRRRLIRFVRQRLVEQTRRRLGSLEESSAAADALQDHALTIGFARRFATYKRAPLLFRDLDRLRALINDDHRPVQFIFAGKAHPRDRDGLAFVQRVYRYTQQVGLRGRIVLLEDYDIEVGRMLTAGCDVWLNTPRRPQEACGTSGMKSALNGGLNCSIPDGWWAEACNGRNGWVIGDGHSIASGPAQDRRDADALYELLEQQVVPRFYERGRDNVPTKWLRMMAESARTAGERFTSERMLGEYTADYYLPAHAEGTAHRR